MPDTIHRLAQPHDTHFYVLAGIALLLIGWFCGTVAGRRVWRDVLKAQFLRISMRSDWSVLLVGIIGTMIPALVALNIHMPVPSIHDEFCYLLSGETFAHGRLTNPTHPMWQHFESFHIIHEPTYQSKYPPAQGMLLALGIRFADSPIAAVWLGNGLACAAVCWMLMAWVPKHWALLGGLLVAMHPLVLYWGQTFWGGQVAMTGGALLLGSLRRILQLRRKENLVAQAIIFGLALAILANSRPFEGLLTSLPSMALLGRWMLQRLKVNITSVARVALPVIVLMILNFIWIGYYNFQVTESATKMPYMVHDATYEIAPPFVWMNKYPVPNYRHEVMREWFEEYQLPIWQRQQSLKGFAIEVGVKFWRLVQEYVQPWLIGLPLLVALILSNRRWMRFAWLTLALTVAGLMSEILFWPHYAAPLMPVVTYLLVMGLRQMRAMSRTGRMITRTTLIWCGVSLVTWCISWVDFTGDGWHYQREGLETIRTSEGGKHIIFVRYLPGHVSHDEWVYNHADIDNSPVIWARDMGREKNQELIDYFPDRKTWQVEVDFKTVKPDVYRP